MSDPKLPKSTEQPLSAGPEEEADLSRLGNDGVAGEANRVVVRWARDRRKAAKEADEQRSDKRSLDLRQRIVVLRVVVTAVFAAILVVVAGLFTDADVVSSGLIALCSLCAGLLLYLRSLGK